MYKYMKRIAFILQIPICHIYLNNLFVGMHLWDKLVVEFRNLFLHVIVTVIHITDQKLWYSFCFVSQRHSVNFTERPGKTFKLHEFPHCRIPTVDDKC
jgi:hypothetical protein